MMNVDMDYMRTVTFQFFSGKNIQHIQDFMKLADENVLTACPVTVCRVLIILSLQIAVIRIDMPTCSFSFPIKVIILEWNEARQVFSGQIPSILVLHIQRQPIIVYCLLFVLFISFRIIMWMY